MTLKKRLLAFCLAVVLVTSAFIQLKSLQSINVMQRNLSLVDLLPQHSNGWSWEDRPVAETAEIQQAVDYWLNYNEAVFRIYRRNAIEVGLYVAYWRPGRIHPRLIQQHTPDICWTKIGWSLTQSRGTIVLTDTQGNRTRVGQHRKFRKQYQSQDVAYWHLFGGVLSGYSQGELSASEEFAATWLRDIRYGQREQYFIRISANVPLGELGRTELLDMIIKSLGPIGLTENAAP